MRASILMVLCAFASGAAAQGALPETDQSGHGAVLCSWRIAIDLSAGLEMCFPGRYADLRADNNAAIIAMNGFIARNSVPPTTNAAVQARTETAAHQSRARLGALSPDRRDRECREIGDFAAHMARITHADRQKSLDDLLSVPRAPLMNPCL